MESGSALYKPGTPSCTKKGKQKKSLSNLSEQVREGGSEWVSEWEVWVASHALMMLQ